MGIPPDCRALTYLGLVAMHEVITIVLELSRSSALLCEASSWLTAFQFSNATLQIWPGCYHFVFRPYHEFSSNLVKELNFRNMRQIHENYAPQKFGAIR